MNSINTLRKWALAIDTFFERAAITALLIMILIVVMQVMTRKLFNFVFFWSEEITLLLLVWFSFMGMAVGFREDLHLGMDLLQDILPPLANTLLDKIVHLSTVLFGLYLIVQGWDFALMMHESTLPATKLPNSALYVVMPVTGVMTVIYGGLRLFGVNTKRHSSYGEE